METKPDFVWQQRSGRPLNSRCCCHDSGANGAIHVGGCCTWGSAVLEKFRGDRSVVRQCLESIMNNSETVSLQVCNIRKELKPPDFDSRRGFANLVFNKMEEQHDWLHTVLWTDESAFHALWRC
ncbi:hypothetical protein CEXT_617141 [Caerostris extrusa]|uniref:Uncharacterized protein n=1 Tax=Caerostris extrusa TaxID=172846 RepID=A0AAV4XTV8_CAEEX|nr:hypothetical protein CEXT_617141 [Caerostris extrusa]